MTTSILEQVSRQIQLLLSLYVSQVRKEIKVVKKTKEARKLGNVAKAKATTSCCLDGTVKCI